jgi:hypothetical protein
MANRAGNPIKTVSEPGVVADFNARNHCIIYLEPAVSSGHELSRIILSALGVTIPWYCLQSPLSNPHIGVYFWLLERTCGYLWLWVIPPSRDLWLWQHNYHTVITHINRLSTFGRFALPGSLTALDRSRINNLGGKATINQMLLVRHVPCTDVDPYFCPEACLCSFGFERLSFSK